MNLNKIIQFGFSASKVLHELPDEIVNCIHSRIKEDTIFCSIELREDDPLYDELVNANILIGNTSLIRLVREYVALGMDDIVDAGYYELLIDTEEVNIVNPSKYYNITEECKYCGRYVWTQVKDLEIDKDVKKPIGITNNSELLLSTDFQQQLVRANINNIGFRKTNKSNTVQLVLNNKSKLYKSSLLIEEGICSKCGKPRIQKYEKTNGVSLFSGISNKPRIEYFAILKLKNAVSDISFLDYEFGTLGRIPEGTSAPKDPFDFSFDTKFPKIVVSGKFAKMLIHNLNGKCHLLPVII